MQYNLRACNFEHGSKQLTDKRVPTGSYTRLLNIGLIASFATVDDLWLSRPNMSNFHEALSSSSSLLLYYNLCLLRYWKFIYMWLEMARNPISRSSGSLENSGPVSFLYITKQIYSPSLEVFNLGSSYTHFIVFNSQSLEVLNAHTHSPI